MSVSIATMGKFHTCCIKAGGGPAPYVGREAERRPFVIVNRMTADDIEPAGKKPIRVTLIGDDKLGE